MTKQMTNPGDLSRRELLRGTVGAATLTAMGGAIAAAKDSSGLQCVVKNGRIKQSVVAWCFTVMGEKWSMDRVCQVAKGLGCGSVELVDPVDWPTLKKHGLECAISPCGMPGAPYVKGFNNLAYHDEILSRTKKTIDACADFGCKNVIAFNGYKWRDAEDPTSGEISREEGAKNCVIGLKKLVRYAEKKGITVCIEILNSRDTTHPMKGHPGYQGDDVDYVADIIRKVDSPNFKMLFDIYHVQVMNGDVIRRLGEMKDIIGHVHTAGVPGRGELDEDQELWYPAVMRKLLDIGYDGYVGQEFIPTRDPIAGLKQACTLCDV